MRRALLISICGFPDTKTRYEAIPIRIKRTVHTTGKSQPGGDSAGLLIVSKVSMPPRVISADNPPTSRGIARQIKNCFVFLLINNHLHSDFMKVIMVSFTDIEFMYQVKFYTKIKVLQARRFRQL